MSRIKEVLEEGRGEQFTIMGNVFTNNNNNVDLGDPERELLVPISGDSEIESGVLPETVQVSGEGASVPTTEYSRVRGRDMERERANEESGRVVEDNRKNCCAKTSWLRQSEVRQRG